MTYLSAPRIHNGQHWLPQGSVIAVNENGTIEGIYEEGVLHPDRIQFFTGILCPGFVNTHCHLELSHLKGLVEEGQGLVAFLKAVMLQRNRCPAADREMAMFAAMEEMKQQGIVAVGDIANGTDTLKLRREATIAIHTFVECLGFTELNKKDRFAYSENVYRQFSEQSAHNKRRILRQSIVPHAPYSVSEGMFRLIDQFDPSALLSIHNEETAAENEFYQHKSGAMFELYEALGIDSSFFKASGKTTLQTFMPWLDRAHPVILVHNTFMEQSDLLFLKQLSNRVHLCLCPRANLYIENRLPPIQLFLDSNIPICLGTDSLASNHSLSILAEMQCLQESSKSIALEVLLKWATYNGARALNLDAAIGSLTIGKTPGIVNLQLPGSSDRLAEAQIRIVYFPGS